jgi:polyhydroxyalkanoate synthesis repressor PhaR
MCAATAGGDEGRGGDREQRALNDETATSKPAVVIKKYANRRLYNTATSTYVTLDDLAQMVKSGTDFVVYDAKTGEDITRSVLTQIIFEEENKGQNLLPINFLRQLIRFYGDSMQAFVPGYLEFSLESLAREQEKFRHQMVEAWGADPFKAIEEQTKRNMAMFSDAMRMWNPFGATARPPADEPKREASHARSDLEALRDQLAAMQKKIDSLAGDK